MWHWNVRKSQGFTLIEMLATAIIISIVAAIAAPNLLGLLNRNRVNQGLAELEGAIQEVQRQAIRSGKSCTVTIDTSDNDITGGCLLSTRNLNENLDITTNVANNGTANNYDIVFSGKGNTSNNGAIFVIYMSSGTNQQKCFVIDNSLGATRTGEYTGDPTGTLNVNNCS
ncbi:MAG: prepilin-type N-terminal cleavage/methylation domain-containing protein [Xenococcaceae cyanobacterium MO_234.B1]|nr:prepilin-type N-terminal cleavage/methylation domain-containing protein [Xenococcaceae cyanobacterium MO_234.B1]